MTVTVDEALKVLEDHANSPRVQHALSTLRNEMDRAPFRHGAPQDESSRKHPFPSKDKINQLLAKDKPQPDPDSAGQAKGDVTAGERA